MALKNNLFSGALALLFVINAQAQVILTPLVDSIPMRDGRKLAADIYLPNSNDTFPVILIQTPYNRIFYRLGLPLGIHKDLAQSHYAIVVVDWRCYYGSSAACIATTKRGEDGYDVIDWIKDQSWSNGKIGSWGPSALGRVQYLTMKEKHPNHICAVPLVAATQYFYQEYFPGGAARTEYIQQLDGLGFGVSPLLYANPVYNYLWFASEKSTMYPDSIQIPVLMVGGWYDHNIPMMMELYHALRNNSPAASNLRLLFGPWAHGGFGAAQVGTGQQGELQYPAAAGWSDSLAMVFFDYWLRGIPNQWNNSPFVQYFQMGDDQWQSSPDWPPVALVEDTLFLSSGGTLQRVRPTLSSDSASFDYNPADPSPTWGGPTLRQDLHQGPYDQSHVVESRSDLLIYQTAPLSNPVVMKGPVHVHLTVKSDRKDTDFTVRLTDVYPDGRSMLLYDQIQRMRFRNGYWATDTAVMIPGQQYEIDLMLPDQAITFLPGHRIRLDVSSSDYPRFDTNLNNGGTMYTAGDTLIAHNTIFQGSNPASYITLQLTHQFQLGLSAKTKTQTLRLAPNPAFNKIRLMNLPAKRMEASIFDMQGQLVKTLRITGPEAIILLDDVENGLYFLKISGHDFQETIKFTVIPAD